MTILPFFKYQGTGNDFVIIDNRETVFDDQNTELIARLCDRKFGVGSDGLILIDHHSDYDFEMVYFNADGTRATCGNGARCAVDLAHRLGIIQTEACFTMEDDPYEATWADQQVRLRMVDVPEVQAYPDGLLLNTGTRHFVRFVENLSDLDVVDEGRPLRYEDRFAPIGANINFTERHNGAIHMRIYEKGVEDETLSSGTGATAVALAWSHTHDVSSPIVVHTRGGVLTISFERTSATSFAQVFMAGPAQMVFQGTVFV